jgi:hypothetical protein
MRRIDMREKKTLTSAMSGKSASRPANSSMHSAARPQVPRRLDLLLVGWYLLAT